MQNLKELITIENKKRYNEIMMFNHRAFIISTRSQHPYVENVWLRIVSNVAKYYDSCIRIIIKRYDCMWLLYIKRCDCIWLLYIKVL